MYQWFLSLRYLRTRAIGMVSVSSVMLGVGAMIVVNSVMGGFQDKLRDRLHAILADVVIESVDANGFGEPERVMEVVKQVGGDRVVAMTPTVECPGLIMHQFRDRDIVRHVMLVGIDPKGRAAVGGFKGHLVNEENRADPSFEQRADAKEYRAAHPPKQAHEREAEGAIIGYQLATAHARGAGRDEPDIALIPPGADIVVTTINAGKKAGPVFDRFVAVDWFRSDMSEYDASYVFLPIKELQETRNMGDRVSTIQIKLRDYADAKGLVADLKARLTPYVWDVKTWEEKQGVLLRAVQIEQWLLNFIMFFIIAVAGFGILATFFMIVLEKTKDIGVLKALGASDRGVMGIFMLYAVALVGLGCLVGAALGTWFTFNINDIERFLSARFGVEIFPRDVYYFREIPTKFDVATVLAINLGAVLCALLASYLPARRAALLRPVEALRHE